MQDHPPALQMRMFACLGALQAGEGEFLTTGWRGIHNRAIHKNHISRSGSFVRQGDHLAPMRALSSGLTYTCLPGIPGRVGRYFSVGELERSPRP
jgi:hypothetical protein